MKTLANAQFLFDLLPRLDAALTDRYHTRLNRLIEARKLLDRAYWQGGLESALWFLSECRRARQIIPPSVVSHDAEKCG